MSALWLASLMPLVVGGVWAACCALVGYWPSPRRQHRAAILSPQEAQERVRVAAWVARQAARRLAQERAQAARLDAALSRPRELSGR